MVKDVKHLSSDSTYHDVQQLLKSMPKLRAFPLVDSKGGVD